MVSVVVVEGEIVTQTSQQSRNCRILPYIDVLVLDRAPETLDEDIVVGTASSIHTDADASGSQNRCECLRRELTALVRVEYLGLGHSQRLFKCQSAEVAVQGVGELPGQDVAAVPVDDCGQIHESLRHRHIGFDVSSAER